MEKINFTYRILFLFLFFTSCAKDQNIPFVAELIESIVTESQSPADGGTPSIDDLSMLVYKI